LTKALLVEGPPEISADRLMYTFKVRDGVKWHDGQPFTPEDVLFTFKATMCPAVDSASVRSYLTDLKDIQLEGRTIRFLMSKPNVFNHFNIVNILAIMPKHVFDPDGLLDGFSFKDIIGPQGKTDPKIKKFGEQFNKHPANRAPIGTGPYKFEKWDTGREIVLARNDNYWGEKGHLDKIVIRIITDYPAALTALKAGDVDLMPRLLPVQYAQQTSGPAFDDQFVRTKYSIPGYFWIGWNEDRPFFKDKRVRQALTMLVNRQQIIDKVRFGLGRIAVAPINPSSRDFNPDLKPWPYDPKRAAELLDESGWKDHDGDGIRDKDGVKFKFEFLHGVGSTLTPQLVPILREEFRKVGIEMTDRIVEFNVMSNNLREHQFDASSLGWTVDLTHDPYQVWHSSSALNRGSNYVNFKNAESDRLIEQARLEFDDEKRKQIYWQWQELIHEEQPYTFLYYQEEGAAYSKRFQNVNWWPLRPGYELKEWFVPKGLQKYGTTPAP
jgi:peptide/nickel transport system substrate-binding protein